MRGRAAERLTKFRQMAEFLPGREVPSGILCIAKFFETPYNPSMAAVRPIRSAKPEPVGLHTQAMDNLRFIRSTMESAGSFTAVPGRGGMVMGATALFAAFAAHLAANSRDWLLIWMAEAVLALAIGLAFSYRKAMQNS